MNQRVGILMVILAVQLVAVGALAFMKSRTPVVASLLQFEAATIDALSIADNEGESVALAKVDNTWLVDNLQADNGKVNELIDTFADMDAAWPVATSGATAERFEVTDDNYQRRIELGASGSVVGAVLLGTSPGYRRVHGRVAESDEVYSIAYSNYQAATGVDDWLDKALLQPDGGVEALAGNGWGLVRVDDAWVVNELGDTATDQDVATGVVDRVSSLRVLGVGETPPANDATQRLSVTDAAGEYHLDIVVDEEATDALVRSTRIPNRWFKVASYTVEQLLKSSDDFAAVVAADESIDNEPTPAQAFLDEALNP